MRRRVFLIALGFFLAYLAAFAASGATSSLVASTGGQPTTTEPPSVEVEAKVVEQGPLKDPVDVADLAQTGSDGVAELALVGLALVAVGLVLIDLVGAKPREATPRS